MSKSFAVDVGGTFTDLVVLDETTGGVEHAKAPTTPSAPARGVLAAVAKSDLSLPDAQTFFHGTTLGLNAMLEREGALTGLITTLGFRDALELRRLNWPMYQLHWRPPPPLVPRHLRREVRERVRADGTVLHELDVDGLLEQAGYLVDRGVGTVAVCFVHAYAHPQHELQAGKLLAHEFPGLSVTLSHDVTREYREYERTATTVADASIKPRMNRYIGHLEEELHGAGYRGAFVLTRCDGGVMSASEARQRPVRTLISGPASGVMGVVTLSRWLGLPNVIGCDMGGTSFDASLIIDHEPTLNTMTEIADLPLLMPVIELETIGAGGGSIGWIDAGGALNVGPQSAGSEPGPVCYGKGGTRPTFSDAALVSGLLDGERFLSGEITLDAGAAREAIGTQLADPLGVSVEDAAAGVVALAEAKMAATLEKLTIEKGHNPRDFTLLAFGGGGSLIAGALASRLGIPQVIVPLSPGTFSAWGMLTLDFVHDFASTVYAGLDALSAEDVTKGLAALERQAVEVLDREGVPAARQNLLRSVDLRYSGQEHVLAMALDSTFMQQPDLDRLRADFDSRHETTYGYALDHSVEVAAYRLRAVGTLEKPRRHSIPAAPAGSEPSPRTTRTAVHRESGGELEWAVYDRERLLAGHSVDGPAIVEEAAATTLVGLGQRLRVDDLGNLVITVGWPG